MSRSYKKTLGYCDRNPWAKRQANKKVRRTWDIDSGGAYKKLYDSYAICDYKFLYYSEQEYIQQTIELLVCIGFARRHWTPEEVQHGIEKELKEIYKIRMK